MLFSQQPLTHLFLHVLSIFFMVASAYNLASQSQEELNGFAEKAIILRENAIQQGNWDFNVNFLGSIVGAVAIICSSFIIWFVLKRRFGEVGGEN